MMYWFSIWEYVRYRMRAKGRHGTHSPLVYALLDKGLRRSHKDVNSSEKYLNAQGMPYPSEIFLKRFTLHFGFSELRVWSDNGGWVRYNAKGNRARTPFQIFYELREFSSDKMSGVLKKLIEEAGPQEVICLKGIHASKSAREHWQIAQEQPQVSLSLDFFHYGFLFFTPAFKERQQFILLA